METPAALLPLSSSDRIADEMIIGLYPASETQNQTIASIQVPSKDAVRRGTKLCVPKPVGKRVSDPNWEQRITNELRNRLGGWFENDVTSFIQLHDDFYYLAFSASPWQVQCVGAPDNFHAVFMGHLLEASEAVGEGGHPRVRPLGEVDSLLKRLAPKLAEQSFTDRTAEHAPNVFDAYLTNERGVTVKAGLRMRLTEAGAFFPGPKAYFYGIRVNLDS